MKIIDVKQGSPEWLALRAKCFTASEAPAMMGASRFQTRDQLLKMKATGETKPISSHQQALFDRGHATEAAARPLVEKIISDDLYPVTGISDQYDYLLASFDGITMMEDVVFEHKLWSAKLAEQVKAGKLDAHYEWQLEQQLLVSRACKVKFVVSDGTPDNFESMDYYPQPGYAAHLIAGWEQFATDLANYSEQPADVVVDPLPAVSLPSIIYKLNGTQLTSNLIDFRAAADQLVQDSLRTLETDQDFADAESLVKSFKEAEDNIKKAVSDVVGEIKDVDQFGKDLGYIGEQIRQARLNLDKSVKTRKVAIREEVVSGARNDLAEFLRAIDPAVNRLMPRIDADFEGAIKGKRTLESLRGAVNDELAKAKIYSNQVAEGIRFNLSLLEIHAAEYKFLFNDLASFITKEADDFGALVQLRVTNHKKAEADRLEQQREQMRIQEERKAKTKAQAEIERQRRADMAEAELKNRADQEAHRQTLPEFDAAMPKESDTVSFNEAKREAEPVFTQPTKRTPIAEEAAVVGFSDINSELAGWCKRHGLGVKASIELDEIICRYFN